LPPPAGGATVRLLAEFENSMLNATTADRTFKVGAREVKLSEVATIQFQPAVRVVLQDGKAVEGVVSGLEAVPVNLGEQSLDVNLVKAAAVRFGPAAETDQVSYTLVVRQGDKEILRQTESIGVEGLLPSLGEATGQNVIRAPKYATAMAWGKLYVFERGSNGKLMHRSFDPQKKEWSKWEQLGDKESTSPPSALSTPAQLVVFFRGSDGKLYHIFQNIGSGWSEVIGLGAREMQSGPTAVMVGWEMTVFARGKNGKLMKTYYDRPKNAWSDWSDVD